MSNRVKAVDFKVGTEGAVILVLGDHVLAQRFSLTDRLISVPLRCFRRVESLFETRSNAAVLQTITLLVLLRVAADAGQEAVVPTCLNELSMRLHKPQQYTPSSG